MSPILTDEHFVTREHCGQFFAGEPALNQADEAIVAFDYFLVAGAIVWLAFKVKVIYDGRIRAETWALVWLFFLVFLTCGIGHAWDCYFPWHYPNYHLKTYISVSAAAIGTPGVVALLLFGGIIVDWVNK